MKRKRFSEEHSIGVLKEAEADAKTADLARQLGVSEATIYIWKAKYGGSKVCVDVEWTAAEPVDCACPFCLRRRAPAHFASDGERLHVRSWSFHHREWRDYVPVRVLPDSTFDVAPVGEYLPRDADWEELVEIRLRPLSSLTEEQQAAVRLE